ncbi:hypothetical protein BH11ACT5_BH11ACT5_15870 [soil metagenome]
MTVLPRVLAAIGALALGLGGALVVAAPASATTVTVSNNIDDGLAGSLSYALSNYTAGDTIDITTAGPIIAPAAGLPTIFDDVTITGPAGGTTIVIDATGGGFNVSAATLTMTDVDVTSDAPGSGQGILVLDGSLILSNASVRDFDINIFYVDSAGGNTITLTDVDAGGALGTLATMGVSIQDDDGGVSLTRVSVSYTDGVGVLIGTGGGSVDLDTVSAVDGSGILIQSTDTTITAAHVTTARTPDGLTVFLDGATLDLSDLQVSDTDDVGAVISATNGSTATLSTAMITTSADSGIVLEAEDSSIVATGVESHHNGPGPLGCGCVGGFGSGIELYGDNSTVKLKGANTHDNTAARGGGIYVGEASNASTVTISGATVSDNTATGGYGGGIDLDVIEDAGTTVTITGTTISGNSAKFGGGVAAPGISAGATVKVTGSTTITDNHVTEDGGGIIVESLADDGSSFTLSDSTVSLNTSVDFGAGVYLLDIGAGTTNTAKAIVQRTTVDSNTAGGYGGGIAINDPAAETTGKPTVLIDSTTVSNNVTPYGGGGIHVRRTSNGPEAVVKVVNSTVSGNDAQLGGGIDLEAGNYGVFGGPGVPYIPGPDILRTVISQSTIAGNSAHTSAGVAGNSGDHTIEIDNSIVSGGTSNNGNTADDFDPSPTFAIRYSLVQSPRAGTVIPTGVGNVVGVDPLLAALANNGGSTKTRLVAPGSPAYNAGNPAFVGAGLLDQRGQARVYQRLDMGAVEWHPALAYTGQTLTPGPPLVAFLLLFSGLAMVAFSRLRSAAA